MVVGRMVHLEDISGSWTMAGSTLCMMRGLVIIDGVPAHLAVTTWTVHLYHVLFYMNLDALLGGAPATHQAHPLVILVLKGSDMVSEPLLGPVGHKYEFIGFCPITRGLLSLLSRL